MWSEEVRARLLARCESGQELYVHADIRAALGEIERLRGLLATEEAERIRCRDGWAGERAEIERLREVHWPNTIKNLQAEVERLRQDLYDARHALSHCVPGRQAAEARVRTLEHENGELHKALDGYEAQVVEQEAEIKRLREDRDRLVASGAARIRTLEAALRGIVDRFDHADKIKRPIDGLAVAMAHDARLALGDTSPFTLAEEGKP